MVMETVMAQEHLYRYVREILCLLLILRIMMIVMTKMRAHIPEEVLRQLIGVMEALTIIVMG
jgi:hypothetical protein